MCPSSSAVPVYMGFCLCVLSVCVCVGEGAFIYGSALVGETAASLAKRRVLVSCQKHKKSILL